MSCQNGVMYGLVHFVLLNTRCAVSLPVSIIYTSRLVKKVQSCGYGCYVRHNCVSILLYADNILLLAPLVSELQLLLSICEMELKWLDLSINIEIISMSADWPTIQC